MNFFDDDNTGIGNFLNEVMGRGSFSEYDNETPKKVDENLNLINVKEKSYFVFDLSIEDHIEVEIVDQIVRNNYGEKVATGKKVLRIKNLNEILRELLIPKSLKIKNFEWTFNNGILEVSFKK